MSHKQDVHVAKNDRRLVSLLAGITLVMLLMVGFSPFGGYGQPRTVRVGVYQNEPKIFMDKNGSASGIFIELLDEIAAQEGWSLVYVPCEWAVCLQALEDGEIDLMPDVAYSTERDEIYDFHNTPVIESWSRVYSSSSTPINKISDLDGKRVAVLQGSIQQTVFEQLMNGFGYEVTIVPADSFEQAFALTAEGSADGAVSNHLFGDYFYQKYGLLKTIIDFNPVALYYATAEGRNPDLLEAIDRNLDAWIPESNSTYYTTLGKWAEKETDYRLPQYVYWGIGGVIGLLVVAAGIILLLRQQVRVRTRHLEHTSAELRKSEERYRTLASISPVGIFRTDAAGSTTYVNPKWCEISGLSFNEALGDGWLEAIHPDDKERLREGWRKSAELHKASFSDYRFVRPDGTIAWVMGQAVPEMKSEENQIVGYVGTITDITERKRVEAALRESEQKLRAIFEQAPLGIAVIDSTTGRFRTINPQYCNIAGYSESEMLDLTFQRITHPDDLQTDLDGLHNMREGNLHLFQMEKRYICKDGSVVWVGLTSVPLWDEPGADLQHIAMVEDITERMQVEAALQASERQLSLIYANISDILFYLAVEAKDRFRFVSVNSAFLKATGLAENQIVGKLAEEVIPESTHALVFGNYKEAVRTKKAVGWEEVSVYPSGKKYGEVSIIPILDADGNCTHLIGTVHDITERKQAEEEIFKLNAELEQRVKERTLQLEVANKDLESFSYSVSHDLRAPLRAVSGFAEIVARRHRASLNAEGQHYVDNIVQASGRMGHLIDDLLTYARLGRSSVRREPVSLASLVNEIVSNMQSSLDEVHGTINIASDLPTIIGDPTLLRQIFTNLLENAVKYHKPGYPPNVTVACQSEDRYIIVRVSDTGIGIPAEYQEKIFNIFQRLHSEDEYPGTGIGLATVRKSVELLGGRVWAESKPEEGSTFSVELTCAP